MDGIGETVEVLHVLLCILFLGGDQLTVARARGAIKNWIHSPTASEQRKNIRIPCNCSKEQDYIDTMNFLNNRFKERNIC